tara:strand:+ start:40 stop:558 length:519 start_codon:yes stop_codon:yes gene_type:complete
MTKEKQCTKCGETKPLDEYHKYLDGCRTACKSCSSIRRKQYHLDNKQRLDEYNRQYHEDNAFHIRKRQKENRKKRRSPAIYEIINKENGKVYIGQTKSYKRRWATHRGKLERGEHRNYRLRKDCDQYGIDVFEFRIVEEFMPDTESEFLLEKERETIIKYIREGKDLYNKLV